MVWAQWPHAGVLWNGQRAAQPTGRSGRDAVTPRRPNCRGARAWDPGMPTTLAHVVWCRLHHASFAGGRMEEDPGPQARYSRTGRRGGTDRSAAVEKYSDDAMFRAGAVAYDITPALGVPLAGAFSARYAVDVDDPLFARAVVLED